MMKSRFRNPHHSKEPWRLFLARPAAAHALADVRSARRLDARRDAWPDEMPKAEGGPPSSVREGNGWPLPRVLVACRARGRRRCLSAALLAPGVVGQHLVGNREPDFAGNRRPRDREQLALLALEAQGQRGAEALD